MSEGESGRHGPSRRHGLLEELRVPAGRCGYRELRRLARRFPGICWAIEASNGLGRPLTRRLIDDD
ncbi:hypothetical protein, partial [Amycolatopsis ultiminotia]|uniref:hypothetical protein n=1 Tax=Amycolatopsis ultiminotia TaxID=543629 RepID=UPI0031E979F1